MLEVRNLHASIGDIDILRGLNLEVGAGQIHAVMGPNGSGKSTLANVLAGNPQYTVTQGEILFQGQDLLAMAPEDRARAGVFLSFQHPVEIPGVRLDHFMRGAYNAIRNSREEEEMDVLKFDRMLQQRLKIVDVDPPMVKRYVNQGFSGGEKKRAEVLQMAVLEPTLAVLDEPDSGLDVDALRIVAEGINQLRRPDNALILITHYQRILDYLEPDAVHVLMDGRVVRSGGSELALEVESKGYDRIDEWASTPQGGA